MNCGSCLLEEIEYEVKFKGDLNHSILPDVKLVTQEQKLAYSHFMCHLHILRNYH